MEEKRIATNTRRRAPLIELAAAMFVTDISHGILWKSFVYEEQKVDNCLWHQFPEYCYKREKGESSGDLKLNWKNANKNNDCFDMRKSCKFAHLLSGNYGKEFIPVALICLDL
eukprot:Seg3968.2 transcript_id=Seg3968.2/GoldUCD/mRNA.D3Y31 product="hypothetical protein" protein_id=Seg3968.2/GoldUCD/D3Y31